MGVVNNRIERNNNLDIFVMTTNTIEPTLELINIKFIISEWISKTSNVHFNGGKILKVYFIKYVYVFKQILRIVGSQIETKRIFSLAKILTSFKRCLQNFFLNKLIFVNKNWPNDSRIGWKALFSLVGLIENDENSKDLKGVFKELLKGMKLWSFKF